MLQAKALRRFFLLTLLVASLSLISPPVGAAETTVEGGATDVGYNVGSPATLYAKVQGIQTRDRYAVFAEIRYFGTPSATNVAMHPLSASSGDAAEYQAQWPVPLTAQTGLYALRLRVEDRSSHRPALIQPVHGFVIYKKQVRITAARIDKTFYLVGQPVSCAVSLENVTPHELKDLRVEFSNSNYPWISLYSEGHKNLDLSLKVLREHVAIAAGGTATIPMMPAGTAAILQGQLRDVMGSGLPVRAETVAPPEVDRYTIAVWNADRTVLYDMQFTPPAIVRNWGQELPIPYSNSYMHPYTSDMDYTKYRQFYASTEVSPAITVDRGRTMFQPGDAVPVKLSIRNPSADAWVGAHVELQVTGPGGKVQGEARTIGNAQDFAAGQSRVVEGAAWPGSGNRATGIYVLKFAVVDNVGRTRATATQEIAVNQLPTSLMVFNPHEDDERPYGGLIRAAVESGVPVQAVVLTGGDVGACERYYDKACGPNEAHEFGKVRMEESAEALEHIGLSRANLIILGLPDGGSGAIWSEHKLSSDPYLSVYLGCDHAPYENVYRPNLPFARDAVIQTIEELILKFHPAMIALSHPDERHVDHRTANWFVIKACQELLKAKKIDPQTIVLADIAYGAGPSHPAPYQYQDYTLYMSGETSALKQEMDWLYQSQDGNLDEGARKTFAELPREEKHLRILDWQEHEGWNE